MLHETVSDIRVRYAETDQMGVVYHANYLIWCEIGRTDFIRSIGQPYASLEADGLRLAVSEAALRFHASARYDDSLFVHTRLVDVRSRSLTFAYQIVHNDRGLVVGATTSLVSLAADGRAVALPGALRGLMQGALTQPFLRAR